MTPPTDRLGERMRAAHAEKLRRRASMTPSEVWAEHVERQKCLDNIFGWGFLSGFWPRQQVRVRSHSCSGRTRPRGGGRPRARRAVRTSARSGDSGSGDPAPGEPANSPRQSAVAS